MTIADPAAAGGKPSPLGTFQRLLDAHRESIIVVDNSRRIVATNRAADNAFGRQGKPLAGQRMSEVIRDLHLHESIGRALEQHASSDFKMDLLGEGNRSFDIHVSPLDLEGPFALAVFYDVTQMERLERIRQEFLSNISHELRTPLTSMLAFVETLEDGAIDDSENNRRFLGVIRRNAERMHELIADILELSLIESGNVSIDARSVGLRGLVDEVFIALSSTAADRDIELINQVDPEAKAHADPIRLEQMLTNLIDNAIKFNRLGGSVKVVTEEQSARTLIGVIDTGEGILPEHLPRVFERFYRADRGRSREIGGTGLGLAIVKHLAKLHGGEVSVRSVPSEGSIFTIELPR